MSHAGTVTTNPGSTSRAIKQKTPLYVYISLTRYRIKRRIPVSFPQHFPKN